MALRVFSYYPTNIVIDGEIIPIHVSRLNPDQALTFNQAFAKLGKRALRAPADPPEVVAAESPAVTEAKVRAAEAEALVAETESKQFVVQAITDYITVLPDNIFVDDKPESITSGADICRLFGARDEVLSELLLHIFMENKLNAEQKRTWKTRLAPFVPTPVAVATRMVEMAHVTDQDTFYDLGCGAGALCIAAAQKGARAVGFDIDEERILEARAAAKAAGPEIEARCTFEHKDALEVDLKPATVVGLYLLAGANSKLRPVLLEQLPAGARVVSHAFTMGGGWVPSASEFVPLAAGEELAHQGARWVYTYSVDTARKESGAPTGA